MESMLQFTVMQCSAFIVQKIQRSVTSEDKSEVKNISLHRCRFKNTSCPSMSHPPNAYMPLNCDYSGTSI